MRNCVYLAQYEHQTSVKACLHAQAFIDVYYDRCQRFCCFYQQTGKGGYKVSPHDSQVNQLKALKIIHWNTIQETIGLPSSFSQKYTSEQENITKSNVKATVYCKSISPQW